MKALFAHAQRLVGLVLRGYVLERALDARHVALRIAYGQARRAHPEMPLARNQHFGLQIKGRAMEDAIFQGLFEDRAVRRRVQCQNIRRGSCPSGQPESGNNLLRPVQLAAWQFHGPPAYACNAAGHTQGFALLHQLGVHLVAFLHQLGQQALLAAQLQQHHRLTGQGLQALQLFIGQRAGHGVQHRQRAQCRAVGGNQRHAGIQTDMGLAHYQRVVGKQRVLAGIGHHHRGAGAAQCVRAKRNGPFGLPKRHTHRRLEPLPVAVQKIHHCHRRAAQACGQRGQLVIRLLGRRVQNGVRLQRLQARGFLGVVHRCHLH